MTILRSKEILQLGNKEKIVEEEEEEGKGEGGRGEEEREESKQKWFLENKND